MSPSTRQTSDSFGSENNKNIVSWPGDIQHLHKLFYSRGDHFSWEGFLFTSTRDYLDKENQFCGAKYERTRLRQ